MFWLFSRSPKNYGYSNSDNFFWEFLAAKVISQLLIINFELAEVVRFFLLCVVGEGGEGKTLEKLCASILV
jgi:hypothetical protein